VRSISSTTGYESRNGTSVPHAIPRSENNLPPNAYSGKIQAPQVSPPTKWHERVINRFFAQAEPRDPMRTNGRLYIVLAFFLLGFATIIGKLFKVQIVDHDELAEQAASQYRTQVILHARRGVVRDRNGIILASNAFVVKFAVDPKEIKDKEKLAEKFSKTFNKPKEHYLKLFSDPVRRYIVVERDVPQEVAATFDEVKERGLLREVDQRRHYAFAERASHIVGFSSKDGRGLAGIEMFADKLLRGSDGYAIMQRDGRGGLRPDVDYDEQPALNGDDISLTIDERIQLRTEAALRRGVEKANAIAGIAIVMNPRTGEILALANMPDFDPNDFFSASNDMLRNRAITDAFEPGSTMKVLTAAIALEEKVFKPTDKINAENGTWGIEGGAKIKDTHPYGTLTFRQALEKSSNVCFAKISDKIERRKFYKYMRDFGLGVLTGVDLPGEVKGNFRKPDRWGINSKRYIAFGYEMTSTPLQLAAAYAAIANDGVMMKPYIISKRTSANGEVADIKPQELRRVVSVEAAQTLRTIMQGAVDSGTGTTSRIKGVAIAGKTGTAQQLVNGHYSKQHYTSSFIGFFPANRPEYEILVILRSPRNGYYGGAVSGPIFREIAAGILDMNGKLPPEGRSNQPLLTTAGPIDGGAAPEISEPIVTETSDIRELPNVRGLKSELARSLLASQGFIVSQSVPAGIVEQVEIVNDGSVKLTVRAHELPEEKRILSEVPNFIGMPMARAIKFAASTGIGIRLTGSGSVLRQEPEAGASITTEKTIVTLFGEE
jgi:cell division protein FtsI (penicillin-binding protein 3)